MIYYYNVHNIVKVRSEVILYELEYFRADKPLEDTDLTVEVKEPVIPVTILKRKMFVEDGNDNNHTNLRTLKYTEHFGILGAQFEINFESTCVHISVNNLIARSKHVLYVNLFEPIMRFIFLYKGYVLLHSACITNEIGNACLLSAPPDTGKTTAVLKCLKSGFFFLSDDMTILKLPNIALCFPKPMTISSHTFQTATSVSNNPGSGFSSRFLKLRSIIHSKEGRQFMRNLGTKNVPIFTLNAIGQSIIRPPKFKVEDLLQNINVLDKTEVRRLMFLEKSTFEEDTIMTKSEALRKAIENSDDAFLFPPYRDILQNLRIGNATGKDLLDQERSILDRFLSNVDCMTLKSNNRSWFQHVIEISNYNEKIQQSS
jgi:dolichol-phosphate mannosyltransferase